MAADDSATFAVKLDASGVSKGAASASAELVKLKKSIEGDQKELKELEGRMKLMQSGSSVNAAEFKKLKEQIQAKKDAIAKSGEAYTALGGKLGDLGKKTTEAGAKTSSFKDRVEALGGKLAGMPGPVGTAGGSLGNLAKYLLTPKVAALALTVGLVVAAAALAFFVVKMADAARTNRIVAASFMGSEAAGASLQKRIVGLSKEIPMARQEIQGIAAALADKGLKGSALENAMSAIARAQSVLGAGAAGKLQAIAEKSKDLKRFTAQALDFQGSGITLDDVANALAKRTSKSLAVARESIKAGAVDLSLGLQAMDDATKNKMGSAAEKLAGGLGGLMTRASDNLADFFASIDIEPLLSALKEAVALLDTSTSSGKALKAIMSTVFTPLATIGILAIKATTSFVKGLIIATLYVALAALKAANFLMDMVDSAVDKFNEIKNMTWSEIGTAIIDGIVNGIKKGLAKIKEAANTIGDTLKATIDGSIERKSPAKYFVRTGVDIDKGLALGMEQGADEPRRVARNLLDLPALEAKTRDTTTAALASRGGGAGGRPVQHITVHVHGVEGADDPRFEERLARALRNWATQTGAMPMGAT